MPISHRDCKGTTFFRFSKFFPQFFEEFFTIFVVGFQ